MSGHTPGPWVVSYGIPFCKADGDSLFFPNRGLEEIVANALLIAAAPRMYAVVEARAAAGDAECFEIMESINGRA